MAINKLFTNLNDILIDFINKIRNECRDSSRRDIIENANAP